MAEPSLSDAVNSGTLVITRCLLLHINNTCIVSVCSYKAAVNKCASQAGNSRPADYEDHVLGIVNDVIPCVKVQ